METNPTLFENDPLEDLRSLISPGLEEQYVKKSVPFEALSHGLGLEVPIPAQAQKDKPEIYPTNPNPNYIEEKKILSAPALEHPLKPKNRLRCTLAAQGREQSTAPQENPPPLPKVSRWPQACAYWFDTLFCFGFSFLTISFVLNFFYRATGVSVFSISSRTLLLYFLPLYLGFSLSYLTLSLGLLDMTLGMWLFGLRIKFGRVVDEARGLKKTARILVTFLLTAPVVTSPLVILFRKGKNLVDYASSTQLYKVE